MTRENKALLVMLVALFGLWGCAQEKNPPSAAADQRLRKLEEKAKQLEKDYRNVSTAREEADKRVADLEKERTGLLDQVEQGKAVSKERDQLKVLVSTRTSERDAVQTQFEELRKGIRSLLGRVESALPPAAAPAASATKPTEPKL
jgi:chromosome segregation ATPase